MNEERKKLIFSKSFLTFLIVNILLCVADVFCVFKFLEMSQFYSILWAVACGVLIVASIIFWLVGLKSWMKLVFVGVIIVSLILWGYYIMILVGLKDIFSSAEALQDAVASTGVWGRAVYVLIQFLQVTFIPLPAMVTTLAGTALFGPFWASILSFIGIMLGSVFAFWLGDKFGEKVCVWIAGKETTEKYSKMLYEKGKYLFFLMMLFPLFPDDILCLIAGMTSMSFRFFITTILITRPIGIVMTCYLGSGQIIPCSGWGLAVWGVIIAIMAVMFICAYKFQPQIENALGRLADKFSKKKNKIKLQTNNNEDNKDETLLLNPPQTDENKQDENKKSS